MNGLFLRVTDEAGIQEQFQDWFAQFLKSPALGCRLKEPTQLCGVEVPAGAVVSFRTWPGHRRRPAEERYDCARGHVLRLDPNGSCIEFDLSNPVTNWLDHKLRDKRGGDVAARPGAGAVAMSRGVYSGTRCG